MTNKSLSVWLLISLLIGGSLGAYLAIQWKNKEADRRVAEAIQVEQDRQGPLRNEVESLKVALERERLQVEMAGIAVEVERKNFGLARQRLTAVAERLSALAEKADEPRATKLREIVSRQADLVADLEALDPQAAPKLQQLFADLQDALAEVR